MSDIKPVSPEESPDYDYTGQKHEVDNIPDWAEEYDVGDEIHWEHDEFDGVQSSDVVGFSTLYDTSYPVIQAPYTDEEKNERGGVETVVVTEDTALKLVGGSDE